MSFWEDVIVRAVPGVLGGSVAALLTWRLVERRLRAYDRRLEEMTSSQALSAARSETTALSRLRWEDVAKLSPEVQTAWLSTRMKDWPKFVDDIQASHEQLEAHRAAGASGSPPGWITLEEYLEKRGLPSQVQ